MKIKVLFCLPAYDFGLERLANEIINTAVQWFEDSPDFEVTVLYDKDAVREKFYKHAVESDIIIVMGHGSSSALKGHKELIWDGVTPTEEEVKDKIISAISCNTATTLGKIAVKRGALVYRGWNSTLWVNLGRLDEFMDSILEFERKFLEGYTARGAYQFSVNKFYEYAEKLKNKSPHSAKLLIHNAKTMELIMRDLKTGSITRYSLLLECPVCGKEFSRREVHAFISHVVTHLKSKLFEKK